MNPKERLLRVLSGESCDRPPSICPGGMMNMVVRDLMEECRIYLPEGHTDGKTMAELAYKVYENGLFENVGVPFCMTVEAEGYGAPVDLGTDIFEPHVKEYILNSVTELFKLKYHPMDLNKGRHRAVIEAIEILKGKNSDAPVIGNITGPVSTATSLMEPSLFYRELRKKNREAHEYMDYITDDLIEFAMAQIDAGADVIAVSDPSGTGEILGPKLFREFTVEYLNRIADAVHEKGKKVIVHICGQMKTVYEEADEIRADALSFDSMVPVKVAKEKLKGRVIMGNVSTFSLEFAGEEKIRTLTRGCINAGSSIISPACGMGMRTPAANIRAMLSETRGESLED